jgi:hypothetical protein
LKQQSGKKHVAAEECDGPSHISKGALFSKESHLRWSFPFDYHEIACHRDLPDKGVRCYFFDCLPDAELDADLEVRLGLT